jgi:hypothetical protein
MKADDNDPAVAWRCFNILASCDDNMQLIDENKIQDRRRVFKIFFFEFLKYQMILAWLW